MRLIRRLLLAFAAFFAMLAFTINTMANSQTVAPTTKFTFSAMAKSDLFTIDIAEETKHMLVDEDGDTLVGAVVRVTPKNHVFGGNPRQTIGTFIYSLIAVCGHNGLVLVQSNLFDPTGKEVQVLTDLEAVPVRGPSTPTGMIYSHLCKGYTGTGSNKVRWI